MCWSLEASAGIAVVGLGTSAYIARKGDDRAVWMTLTYFALMELLQAVTYTVIDQCDSPLNQFLTLLAALHIAFQPLVLNMACMYFIPEEVRKRIALTVYTLSFIGALAFLVKLYPFPWAGHCRIDGEPLCGDILCSIRGAWHIAWKVPMNGMLLLSLGYFIPVLIFPLVYGSWRCTAYHMIVGPLLSWILAPNWNEWPAVWCLFSFGILLIAAKTPLRGWLHVRYWPLWGLVGLTAEGTPIPPKTASRNGN